MSKDILHPAVYVLPGALPPGMHRWEYLLWSGMQIHVLLAPYCHHTLALEELMRLEEAIINEQMSQRESQKCLCAARIRSCLEEGGRLQICKWSASSWRMICSISCMSTSKRLMGRSNKCRKMNGSMRITLMPYKLILP